jgi:hypothetical protein
MLSAVDLLLEVMQSDVGRNPASPEYRYIVTQVAHFGLGAMIATFPCKVGWGLLGLLVAKELLSDIPRDGFAVLTLLDSGLDIVWTFAGWLHVQRLIRHALAKGR